MTTADPLPPDFAELAGDIATVDAAGQDQARSAPQDPPRPSADDEAQQLVDLAAAALGMWYPSTREILTPERRAPVALALAPVLEKYGLTMGDLFAQWAPEIRLAMAVAPLAIPIANAIRKDRQEASAGRTAPAAEKPNPDPAAGDIFAGQDGGQPAP